jgi:PAS domain S-box-containing protein
MSKRTSSSTPKISTPKLTADEQKELRDYWDVYVARRQQVATEFLHLARNRADFEAIIQRAAYNRSNQQHLDTHELQDRAILESKWKPYLNSLQADGAWYAHMGLNFHSWIEMSNIFRKSMLPHLFEAYGRESDQRLLSAIKGMDTMITIATNIIYDAYLNTKENIIRQQQNAIIDAADHQHAKEAIQTSEQRFRALIEQGADEIVLLDAQLKPFYVTPSVLRASSYSAQEIASFERFSIIHIVHPDDQPVIQKMYRKFLRNSEQAQHFQVRLRRKDGSWRWVDGTATNLLTDPSVAGILLNYRDITERKEHHIELEAIASVSAALRGARTRAEMLPAILDQLLGLLHADSASIALCDPISKETVVELARGIWANKTGQRILPGGGISNHVISSGQPYVNNDLRSSRFPDQPEELQAVACIPLLVERETIGVVWVGRKNPIEAPDIRLLGSICNLAANALHRAALQEKTEQRMRHIAALHAIDMAISSSFDLEFVLNVMLDQVINQLAVDAADILLLDPHLNILEFSAGRGFRSKNINYTHIRLGEGEAGRAALERRTISIRDFSTATQDFTRREMASLEGFVTYYGVPLISKGEVKGVLEVFHRQPLNPDAEWLEFLNTLAGQAAIAIADATLFNDLQRSNIELTAAYDATIEGWSRALDLRDKETEGHTRRVTELSIRLAQTMGLSNTELVYLRRGALLHDIGKMGIPDNILLKPGTLTNEEWEIMRRHPMYAYDMLSPIQFLRLSLDIPYCHHEKWDGTGYPRGLKGEEIPLAARIFAVVDIWDALRSDRPYRRAWPEEKRKEYVRSLSGTHLDPHVVEAFIKMISK